MKQQTELVDLFSKLQSDQKKEVLEMAEEIFAKRNAPSN